MSYNLSIDPGIDLGVALWGQNWTSCLCAAVIKPDGPRRSDRGWDQRASETVARLTGWINANMRSAGRLSDAVIEWPQSFGSVTARAIERRGDLLKLAFVVGACYRMLRREFDCRVQLVHPSKWKGTLSKALTNRRIEKKVGRVRCRELGLKLHAWDAVGLGLWAKGDF